MRRLVWYVLVAGLVLGVGPRDGYGQTVTLPGEQRPLREGLIALRKQADVDIVFAERLVQGRTTTCAYEGTNPRAALQCLLNGTNLQARRVRAGQYVIVRARPEADLPSAPSGDSRRARLTGVVTDAETGAPLTGAHVYLPGLDAGTSTDKQGRFAVPALPSGKYRARISYLGYEKIDTVLAAQARPVHLALRPTTLRGEAVVVEDRHDTQAGSVPAPGLVHMPVRKLQQLPSFVGGKDLFQAIQWLPGVRRTGTLNGGLTVRGGSPDQNLYLLDGAPIYHPWHAFSLISTFQTDTFKDVALYRGGFPAEHGGRLASVLDVQMKDGSGRSDPQAVAALGVLSGRFRIESPLTRRSSFMVSARRSYLDKLIGREHPVEGERGLRDTLRTGYYFYDVSAKVTHQPNARHRLSFSYYHGRDNLDLRLPFDVSLDIDAWLKPAPFFFEIRHNWENELFSLQHRYLPSQRFLLSTTGYYSSYHATEHTFIQPTNSAEVASNYRVRLDEIGAKMDLDYFYSEAHQLRGGLHLIGRRFRSTLNGALEYSTSAVDSMNERSHLRALELVGYVQDTWRPAPRWRLQPGLRASFFTSGRYLRLGPRLNVQYAVVPELVTLRGALSVQTQYMHRLRDRYSFLYDVVSSRWIPTSQAIAPSSSVQGGMGVEATPWRGVTITVDGYARRAYNTLLPTEVYREKDGLQGPGISVGALLQQYTPGQGWAYGVEVATHLERGPWEAWLSYAGGRSLSRAPSLGEEHLRPDRFDVPRAFRGIVGWEQGRWSVTLSSEARSGFPHTVPVARYALGDPLSDIPTRYLYRPRINNGRLPPYLRVDLAGAHHFRMLGAEWRAGLKLYNVINHRNTVGRAYDPQGETVTRTDRYGLPLLPLLELSLEL